MTFLLITVIKDFLVKHNAGIEHSGRTPPNTAFLKVGASGGNGVIQYPIFNEGLCADKSYQNYLDGKVR